MIVPSRRRGSDPDRSSQVRSVRGILTSCGAVSRVWQHLVGNVTHTAGPGASDLGPRPHPQTRNPPGGRTAPSRPNSIAPELETFQERSACDPRPARAPAGPRPHAPHSAAGRGGTPPSRESALVVRRSRPAAVRLRRPGAERPRCVLRLHRLGQPRPRFLVRRSGQLHRHGRRRRRRPCRLAHPSDRRVDHGRPERAGPGAGPRGQLGHQVPQRAEGVPVRAGRDHPDRDRVPVAQPARPAGRRQHPSGRRGAGRPAAGLAGQPGPRAVGPGRRHRVAVRGLLHGHLPGRTPVGAQGDPRGGGDRRRGPRTALLVGDPAVAGPGLHHQPDAVGHRRDQALRPGVRADRRRTGARHRDHIDADLQRRLHPGRVRLQHRTCGSSTSGRTSPAGRC